MANYDSNHTGAQIDAGVDIALGFAHSPLEIDSATTIVEAITSSPADIDNAVGYVDALEDANIDTSSIASGLGFIGRFTNTPEDIDATVDKFETVNSQPSQIDGAVNTIENNNATSGQVLTADGTGGCSWENLPTGIQLYHHSATFTKVDQYNHRWAVEWIDTQNGSSASALLTLTFLSAWYRNANTPIMATGLVWDSQGASKFVQGFYFDSLNSKYVLVGDEGASNSEAYSNFNGWSYYQMTRQII